MSDPDRLFDVLTTLRNSISQIPEQLLNMKCGEIDHSVHIAPLVSADYVLSSVINDLGQNSTVRAAFQKPTPVHLKPPVDVSCDLGKIESLATVMNAQLENYITVFNNRRGNDSEDAAIFQGLCGMIGDIKTTATAARKHLYGGDA